MSCSLHALEAAEHTRTEELAGPYALHHFLPAGLLCLALKLEVTPCSTHYSAHWHNYTRNDGLLDLIRPENEPFVRLLDFLILHRFVAVTCRIAPSTPHHLLQLRVYLIPYDLANVDGQLRRRDETTVVNPARKYLCTLLPKLCTSRSNWDGESCTQEGLPAEYFLPSEVDDRTLAEIYNTLPSPVIRLDESSENYNVAQHVLDGGDIPGLETTLYQYQRQTVAAMIQREINPGSVPDPLYVPIVGIDGKIFYLQPATMEILCDRPNQSQSRGGILCEELGTGKTVMTLALIMATMDDLPTPEESILDPPPVLTPLSFRYSPSPAHVAARDRFSAKSKKWPDLGSNKRRIPSLVEHVLDVCRLNPGAAGVRAEKEKLKELRLWTSYKRNSPFYHQFEDAPLEVNRSSRKQRGGKGPKTMYLSAGTLVIVPPNLMNQWASEMNKHCDESLKRFIANEKELPPAQLLALNDVVLMSHSRLSLEATRLDPKNAQKLYSWHVCSCPPAPKASDRVPRCVCDPPTDVSPLLQIRWKRLVVDEGNNLSNANTALFSFLKDISVESKWIVTGTPTTNLMGLQFGIGELQYPDEEAANEGEEAADVTPIASASASRSVSPTAEVTTVSPQHARVWTKQDRGDLNKLGTMISSFLEVPQFAAGSKVFSNLVIAPLMDPAGPKAGAMQVLTQVMESTMIRHRIEDIETEIFLPTLSQETVLLDMDLFAVKTYNVLQAIITVNAITSKREGADYFFHANNVKALLALIENISQAMFWHTVDDDIVNFEHALATGKQYLDQPDFVAEASLTDIKHLKDSVAHLEQALTDAVWRSLQKYPVVHSRVYNMPLPIYHAWSNFPSDVGQLTDLSSYLPYVFLNGEHLVRLRNCVVMKPLSPVPRLIELGELVREEERYRTEITQARESQKRTSKKQKGGPKFEVGPETMQKLQIVQNKLVELGAPKSNRMLDEPPSTLLRSSPLAGIRWGNTPSAKLNYILNEVHQFATNSKFLIFSKSPLTLAYVAEGLSLLNVKYTTTVHSSIKVLEQNVTTFESSDTLRVFLMDLKYGARGLNIVTASRVIFCEPVWQADVETQAIKRVHRIGQTSPVSVKTLAIRSTAEEAMLNRRAALKRRSGTSGKLPGLTEDRTMRDFIANPKFLPPPSAPVNGDRALDYSLLPELPQDDDCDSTSERITLSIRPSLDGEVSSISIRISPKRPRTVLEEPDFVGVQAGLLSAPPSKRRKGVQFV